MSDDTMVAVFYVLLAASLGFCAMAFYRTSAQRKLDADELSALFVEAEEVVKTLSTSAQVKSNLMEDVEIFSNPIGGSADILRLMIRFMPTHYQHDIAGAAMTLKVGKEHGMKLGLTIGEITADHVVLHDVLERQYERDHVDLPKRQRRSIWKSYQKDICFAMDQLNEYPMLLPIIQERGVTDIYEALETAKVMAASDAKPLSSGML